MNQTDNGFCVTDMEQVIVGFLILVFSKVNGTRLQTDLILDPILDHANTALMREYPCKSAYFSKPRATIISYDRFNTSLTTVYSRSRLTSKQLKNQAPGLGTIRYFL